MQHTHSQPILTTLPLNARLSTLVDSGYLHTIYTVSGSGLHVQAFSAEACPQCGDVAHTQTDWHSTAHGRYSSYVTKCQSETCGHSDFDAAFWAADEVDPEVER